jgi:hypothetical protein
MGLIIQANVAYLSQVDFKDFNSFPSGLETHDHVKGGSIYSIGQDIKIVNSTFKNIKAKFGSVLYTSCTTIML